MPNSLYRNGRAEETPAVEPRAYQPAYTSYVTEQIQTLHTVWSYQTVITQATTQPASWGYTYVPDPRNPYAQIRQLVYLPGTTTPGRAVTIPVASVVATVTTRVTPIFHEEVTAAAGSPAMRTEFPPRGWTSFARSYATLPGTATMAFRVKHGAIGVAVGFAAANAAPPTAGYGHLRDGLLFTDNKVARLSDGAALGSYVEADVFTIARKRSGTVTVLRNATEISSYTSSEPPAELSKPTNMATAMYAVGDAVFDPAFAAVAGGSAGMTLPVMTMFARRGSSSAAVMALPLMAMSAIGGLGAQMTMEPMSMFASEARLAQMVGEAPGLELLAYGGTLPVVLNNGADLYLPRLVMSGVMLTGETAAGAMSLEPLTLMAANRVYGEARAMAIGALSLIAFNEPSDEAFAFEVAGFATPIDARTELVVVAFSGIVVGSFSAPTKLLEALANSTAAITSTALTRQLLDAIALSFATFGSTVAVPGLGNDTWVWSPESNGSTSYSNYGFNSFANIGGRPYGANEAGIFALEGDTDAGLPIRAKLSLGKLDFGTSSKKVISEAFIGMSSLGNIFIKVIADGEAYIYQTQATGANLEQQRVKFGKGMKANYLELEIYNEEGADFEIDTVEFNVADLTRKT